MSRVRISGSGGRRWRANPQDTGRVFLPGNGGSVYIDLDHLAIVIVGDRASIEAPLKATNIAPVVVIDSDGVPVK